MENLNIKRGIITGSAFIAVCLIYITACDLGPQVEESESYDLYSDLEKVDGAPRVIISQGEAVGRDSWFEFTIDNIDSEYLVPGVYDGWCIEWNKPIAQQGDMHENLGMYSTYGQDRWRPLNYFLNIKDELKAEDPSLTFREFQAVIWSVTDGPDFDPDMPVDELPPRLTRDGEPNFDIEKVRAIVADVKAGAATFDHEGKMFAMFMKTSNDKQDILVPTHPPISHGYVEGVTPSDDSQFAERTYPVVQADWEGPGGDKRWLGWNLGATEAPASPNYNNPEVAGWYFQFNIPQGHYAIPGEEEIAGTSTIIPGTGPSVINEDSDWTLGNDPCRIALGGDWRIPTIEEWESFHDASDNSVLNLHSAGHIQKATGPPDLISKNNGFYWSKSQTEIPAGPAIESGEMLLFLSDSETNLIDISKSFAQSVRCIED